MPRYFFEIFDGETVPDLEGVEMVDLTAARHAAVDIIADRLRGSGEELWVEKTWRVEVADDTGMVRLMIAVSVEEP